MLIKKALLNTSHLLHVRIATAQNLSRQRLRSRRPFNRQACIPSKLQLQPNGAMETWLAGDDMKPVQLTIPLGQTSHQELISLAESGSPWTASAWESVVLAPTCTAGASAPQQPVYLSGAPKARISFGLPYWPEQPVPLNRGLVAAAPWSSIAAGLIRKKICKSLGIVMPRTTNKIKSLTKIYWEKWYSLSCYLPG